MTVWVDRCGRGCVYVHVKVGVNVPTLLRELEMCVWCDYVGGSKHGCVFVHVHMRGGCVRACGWTYGRVVACMHASTRKTHTHIPTYTPTHSGARAHPASDGAAEIATVADSRRSALA